MLTSRLYRLRACFQNAYIGHKVASSTAANRLYHSRNGVYGYKLPAQDEARKQTPINPLNNISLGLYRLVTAYREHGHRKANIDLLNLKQPSDLKELDPASYGLEPTQEHAIAGLLHVSPDDKISTDTLVNLLDELYCGPMAVEYMHLQNTEEKEWFAKHFELMRIRKLANTRRVHLAKLMLRGQAFDHFLANKLTTVKRYGGEGAESALAFYDELFSIASNTGIDDVLMCIAHRGRLNLLTCLLKYPPVIMFQKMKGKREFPADLPASGDVLSHLTSSIDLDYVGRKVHVTMLPNPSHLEAVNPVCAGKTRARMQSRKAGSYNPVETEGRCGDRVLCLQVHGDSAFSAQGIVAETFTLANLPHYSVGGTVHLIINNQVGYTTEAEHSRSSENCSDIGKMNDCPVIRVNGDHPEEVAKACQLAVAYRERFRKDVIVDYVCYRKYGHNELDEPSFTQPKMYATIRSRPNIPDAYAARLVNEGVCTADELNADVNKWNAELAKNFSSVDTYVPKAQHLGQHWSEMVLPSSSITVWDTGVSGEILKFVGAKSVEVPEGFAVHPTLQKTHIERRVQKLTESKDIDWATAEALAIGSLLHQGFNVRISGQDVGRGTFSQRHAMFVDQKTDDVYIPFNHMYSSQRAFFEVANSPLSEEAVLGFEYGVSIENPNILTLWEAQFGDFFNGAQIIVDTFLTGGEAKWLIQSALTMVLPHGMDGAGPEHSSCRIERFLQLTDSKEDSVDGDDVNLQVANPTTPAQYFHLLRRQMVRNYRKPLIVVGPKVLLRHPAAVSTLSEMEPGTSFRTVLPDPIASAQKVTRVVFVSGKHYYTLDKERKARNLDSMAIVRLESLCPYPAAEIQSVLKSYPKAREFVWCQEEHRNSGAWSFVAPRFENLNGIKLKYIGRPVSAIPATGIGEVHQKESKDIIESVFNNKL